MNNLKKLKATLLFPTFLLIFLKNKRSATYRQFPFDAGSEKPKHKNLRFYPVTVQLVRVSLVRLPWMSVAEAGWTVFCLCVCLLGLW